MGYPSKDGRAGRGPCFVAPAQTPTGEDADSFTSLTPVFPAVPRTNRQPHRMINLRGQKDHQPSRLPS